MHFFLLDFLRACTYEPDRLQKAVRDASDAAEETESEKDKNVLSSASGVINYIKK